MARVGRRLVAAATLLLVYLAAVPLAGSVFTGVTTNPDNSFSAAPGFCDGASPVWLTGFESGVLSAAGAAANPAASLFNTVTGSPLVTDGARSGNYAMRVSKSAGINTYVAKSNLGGGTAVTMRLAVRFGALPSANQAELLKIDIGTGGDAVLGYSNTAPKQFTLGYAGGTAQVGPAAGVVVGPWYRIDLRVDVGANPHTIDWQVDGVAMTTATIAQAADTFAGTVTLGSTVSGDNFFANYDDVLVSLAAADYPIGDGRINSLVPDTYVGKNDFTPAYLTETNGTTNLSATSHQLLDETPMSSSADYVRQNTGSATDYWAEFGFQDVTRTACINGVSAVTALHSAGTTANNVRTAVHTGGVERVVHSGDSVATAALQYRSAVIGSVDGSWDPAELTAVTARVGYFRAGGSVPYWDALRLEYDQVPNAASVYANVVLADSPASYWRLGDTSAGSTVSASAGAITGNYMGSPVKGVGGAVGDTNSAVNFNGSNNYILFGDVYDFAGTVSFTAEAWIRPSTHAAAVEPLGIFVRNLGGGGWILGLQCETCTPANRAFALRGLGSVSGAAALAFEQWHHVVLTYDGAAMRLYVNGVLQQTTATASSVGDDPYNLQVGLLPGSVDDYYFKGEMDELAIYTTALDATRVLAHYNAGRP